MKRFLVAWVENASKYRTSYFDSLDDARAHANKYAYQGIQTTVYEALEIHTPVRTTEVLPFGEEQA